MVNAHTKCKLHTIITPSVISIVVLSLALTTSAQGIYYFEIGANSDNGSQNNVGVRAEIRTHVYATSPYEAANGEKRAGDNFLITEPFSDGSAIAFGYYIYSGHAQWFWHRLDPAGRPEDESVGVAGAVEPNGTWHSYSIMYDYQMTFALRTWDFILDGNRVGFTQQTVDESKATTLPVYVYAEKITTNLADLMLGPVEFRNLTYLKSDGWHQVASLTARAYCLIEPTGQCSISFPFGILELGANHFVAGTGMPKHGNGDLLWTANPFDYFVPYLAPIGLVVLVIVLAYFSIRRIPIFLTGNPKLAH